MLRTQHSRPTKLTEVRLASADLFSSLDPPSDTLLESSIVSTNISNAFTDSTATAGNAAAVDVNRQMLATLSLLIQTLQSIDERNQHIQQALLAEIVKLREQMSAITTATSTATPIVTPQKNDSAVLVSLDSAVDASTVARATVKRRRL